MAVTLPSLYAEAWLSPRSSMRRILDFALSERDRIIMVAVTYVLFAIPFAMVLRGQPLPDGQPVTTGIVLQGCAMFVATGIIGYYISAAILKGVGALFGGTATYETCKAAVAWSLFVIGLAMAVVSLLTFALPAAIASFVSYALVAAHAYVFGSCAAEVHGFKNTIAVIAVVLILNVLALSMMSQMAAQMPQSPV